MSCIYYQDELGLCTKKWDGRFDGHSFDKSKCDYQLKNMDDCPMGITIRKAEDMKLRLEAVEEVFNEMYHDYMNSKTTPLVSNYIPKFVHCLSAFRNKGEET